MTLNKVLVKLYVPAIEENFNVWIPLNKRVYNVKKLLVKAIQEFTSGEYNTVGIPRMYDRQTGNEFNEEKIVEDTTIRNGTELILI